MARAKIGPLYVCVHKIRNGENINARITWLLFQVIQCYPNWKLLVYGNDKHRPKRNICVVGSPYDADVPFRLMFVITIDKQLGSWSGDDDFTDPDHVSLITEHAVA